MRYFSITLVLFLTSCFTLNDDPLYGTPRAGQLPVIKMLALGDSYTIGQSVNINERWPYQLSTAYSNQWSSNISITYVAQTGWTTASLQSAIPGGVTSSPYDLVSLLVGVNNQYQNRSIGQYSVEFSELLQDAIRFSAYQSNRVMVVSIPDYAYTPFVSPSARAQVSAEIDAFNASNSNITVNAGIPYYNITPISRQGLTDTELVAGDGLHPSAKQYKRWVEEVIFPALMKKLTNI